MKDLSSKVSAMMAMLLSLFSFGLIITAFVLVFTEVPVEHGVSRSFAFWIYSMIVVYISLIFYFIDALFSIIKVFMKSHPVYNAILSVLLLGMIPMALFVGGGLGINIYLWNAYHLAVFILEIISIVKHVKLQRQEALSQEVRLCTENNQPEP